MKNFFFEGNNGGGGGVNISLWAGISFYVHPIQAVNTLEYNLAVITSNCW